eukprot:gb/GFBE01071399.1/.p1 GENE.gb/GFBE01071399.1/~~gb/GFBE01071399.1/.p1  ORF type:complete len:121 (+),score=5.45 gb/GFBE01071399.1/:1-363(+)
MVCKWCAVPNRVACTCKLKLTTEKWIHLTCTAWCISVRLYVVQAPMQKKRTSHEQQTSHPVTEQRDDTTSRYQAKKKGAGMCKRCDLKGPVRQQRSQTHAACFWHAVSPTGEMSLLCADC